MPTAKGHDEHSSIQVLEENIAARHVCCLHSYAMSNIFSDHFSFSTRGEISSVGLILFYGSWNCVTDRKAGEQHLNIQRLESLARRSRDGFLQLGHTTSEEKKEENFPAPRIIVGCTKVDEDETSLGICIGDDEREHVGLNTPPTLPALALIVGDVHGEVGGGAMSFVDVDSKLILSYLQVADEKEGGMGKGGRRMDAILDGLNAAINSVVATLSQKKKCNVAETKDMLAPSAPQTASPSGANLGANSENLTGLSSPPISKKRKQTEDSLQQKLTPPILSFASQNNKNTSVKKEPHREQQEDPTIRIFIAGERSQVGKSSVCMGMLGTLLRMGYPPSSLGYIKPATQCEATQLVAKYCAKHRIECTPVGPVVYYKGFTRAFLAGETDGTDALLSMAGRAVDEIAVGKKLVIIDGVGYPSVGSICGTDNASVARGCGRLIDGVRDSEGSTMTKRYPAPVLLVGKSGVGDAVDSYNLNATYFESKDVPVLGSVFNRLPLEGYYSLENCKHAVGAYFDQFKPNQSAFGFIPEVSAIANLDKSKVGDSDDGKTKTDGDVDHAEQFISLFGEHVDVAGIVKAAKDVMQNQQLGQNKRVNDVDLEGIPVSIGAAKKARVEGPDTKNNANSLMPNTILRREQIEAAAMEAGAAAASG